MMSAQYLLLLDSLLARLAYMLNTGLTCGKGSAHKFLVKSVKRPKMEVCRCSYGLQRLILLQCNYHFADGAVKGALPMLERGITIYQMILQYHAWRASHFIHSADQSMGIYNMRTSERPSTGGLVYRLWKCGSGQLLPAPHSAMLLPSVTFLVSVFTAPAISRPFVLRPDSVFLDSYLRAFGEPSHDH